jgi:hypothetical protein
MTEFLLLLKHTAYGIMIGKSLWGYAIFEMLHLFGIVSLVGAITLTDLRLLGVSRSLPVSVTESYLLRWVWGGFALAVFSGISLFISDGNNFIGNPFFISKMFLIAAAGANAAFFEFRVRRGVAQWEQGVATPSAAKMCAALSILLWFAAIGAGRSIAYPELWPGISATPTQKGAPKI